MDENSPKKRKSQWWKIPLVVIGFIIALPLVLAPLYNWLPPVSTLMIYRGLTGQNVQREWRDLPQISDRLKATVILSEDGLFCHHNGIDLRALKTEIERFLAGEDARGASTITMQVARNLFLNNSRSIVRKVLEIPLALYIELVIPKERIFEIYLNIAEWGPDGQFGIEAGTQAAFGVNSENFSWEKAGLMTAMLPNPIVRNAANPTPGMRRIANILSNRAQNHASNTACVFNSPPQL